MSEEQKVETKIRRVWLDLNTGEFSDSWEKGGIGDFKPEELEKTLALRDLQATKLIEYTCYNDPDFEFCDLMKVVTSDRAKARQRKRG